MRDLPDYKFEIVRRIGTVSNTSNSSLDLNLLIWNNGKPKYDLRKWGGKGTEPYKGVTFTRDELIKLYEILTSSRYRDKSNTPKYTANFGRSSAYIYEVLGVYKDAKKMPGQVTYTSWGSTPKYDIRTWNEDYTVCGKGISLKESECDSLIKIIKNELNLDGSGENDTTDIDKDLLI